MSKFETKTSATVRRLGYAFILGVALTANSTASFAEQGTAEQRAACTGDVFRLCKSEIPDVDRIVACMKKQKANLSTPCRAVFASN